MKHLLNGILLTTLLMSACATRPTHKQLIAVAAPAPSNSSATAISTPEQSARRSRERQHLRLVVNQVLIPEYLQTRSIRYHTPDDMIAEYNDAVWAERPEIGLTRILSNALQSSEVWRQVCTSSCNTTGASQLHVEWNKLEFHRKEQRLTAQARWVLRRPDRTAIEQQSTFQVPSSGTSATAYAKALGVLSEQLAQQIQHNTVD